MANRKTAAAPAKAPVNVNEAQTSEPVEAPVNVNEAQTSEPVEETKTIVPAKYAGKYKNGGSGPLSDFIRAQCGEGEKFDYDVFFNICKLNGIADDKIAIYKAAVDEKKNGANGRARMTLGNMLRAIARKSQKLIGTNNKEHDVPEPQIVAAKKAEAAAAAKK